MMVHDKETWARLLPLPLLAAFCLVIWYLGNNYVTDRIPFQRVESVDGVWDLRAFDFDSPLLLRLVGDVAYIPGALLTPEEMAAREDALLIGRPQDVAEAATSRMRVLLPDNGFYMLAAHSIDYAERMYVNGQWRVDAGRPGLTAGTNTPGYTYLTLDAQPVDGMIEIVQQGANFVHREGGSHAEFRIGRPEVVKQLMALESGMSTLSMGLFLALSLAHVALYAMFPAYRANLYFTLICLAWLLRTGVTNVKPISLWFPGLSWYLLFRTEYLCIPITCVLLLLLIREMFLGVLHRWFLRTIIGLSAVFAALCLFSNTVFLSSTLIGYEMIYIITIFYVLARFAAWLPGKIRKRELRLEHGISLLSFACFLYAAIHDAFFHNGMYLFGINAQLSGVALLVFTFMQMTALFYGTMQEAQKARAAEERLSMENAALERASQLKTNMLATISHELRTPLAVMMGYAQIAAADLLDKGADAETTADLDALAREAQRLAQLVEETRSLAIARDLEPQARVVSPGVVIRQIARLYAPILEHKQTRLSMEVEPGLAPVHASANELTQVLFNLLHNADKHTRGGDITLRAAREGEYIAITVSDTGTGIPPALLPHVMERHVHGENGGSGMGLAICREIIETYGGRIAIESVEGKGTAVRLTLRVAREMGNDG